MYRVLVCSRCAVLFTLLALATPSRANFDAGWDAYAKGDFPTAFREWQASAEQGDARAEANLALLYADGHGVPQNCQQALSWFGKAAAQGNDQARYDLGVLYYQGQCVQRDLVKAHMWFNLAAASGALPQAEQSRESVATGMTKGQLAEAQQLARDAWRMAPAHSATAPVVTAAASPPAVYAPDLSAGTRPAAPASTAEVPTRPSITADIRAPAGTAQTPVAKPALADYSLSDVVTKAEEIALRYAPPAQPPASPAPDRRASDLGPTSSPPKELTKQAATVPAPLPTHQAASAISPGVSPRLAQAGEPFTGRAYKVTYGGGSIPDTKAGTDLKLYIDQNQVRFVKDKIDIIVLPASAITEISYGQDVHRRVGTAVAVGAVTLGLGALTALSKSKRHFVGLTWANGSQKGGLAMQCDKNDYRGVLAGLEGITGKKTVNSDTMTVKN